MSYAEEKSGNQSLFGEETLKNQDMFENVPDAPVETPNTNHQKLDLLSLGITPRKNLVIDKQIPLGKIIETGISLKEMYLILNQTFYLPNIRCSFMSANYLYGVGTKEYYCPELIQPKGIIARCPAKAIYFEIRKTVQKSLGYNSTGLPSKAYLSEVLMHVCPNNVLFKSGINLPVDGDFSFVPVSLHSLVKNSRYANDLKRQRVSKKLLIKTANILGQTEAFIETGIKLKQLTESSDLSAVELTKSLKDFINNFL